MVLTVEDGSRVTGADSYISLVDARSFLSTRGKSLNSDDATAEVQLRRAFDFIEAVAFVGTRVKADQPAAWPRNDVYLYGTLIKSDVVPVAITHAQAHVAAAIEAGFDIMPTETVGRKVAAEEVGPIKTEFFESGSEVTHVSIPAVRVLLRPFLSYGSLGLRTARV